MSDNHLTLGSLFTGYGGLDLAVKAVFPGAQTRWVSDIDKGPCELIKQHYPDIPNLGDITTIDWSTVEKVDIIAGGSPCQDVSHAGKRAGMRHGTRSGLWASMREAIAVIQPTYVVWENVKGALSARADSSSELEYDQGQVGDPAAEPVLRALGRVLGDLATLGYDAWWTTFRAGSKHTADLDHVGAPHGRERIFLLARKRDTPADNNGL